MGERNYLSVSPKDMLGACKHLIAFCSSGAHQTARRRLTWLEIGGKLNGFNYRRWMKAIGRREPTFG